MPERKGALTVVGTGIKAVSHLTIEAVMAVKSADIVFHVVADKVTEHWIQENSKECRSLTDFYVAGQLRRATYSKMKDNIVDAVKLGKVVCAVFYGHPGIFVNPSHAAARELKSQGYDVYMQPGVSAEDCLFADLGVDPATDGCSAVEATQFLALKRPVDVTMPLIIWQIGMVGDPTYNPTRSINHVELLVEKLLRYYPPEHSACVYEAALYCVSNPKCNWGPISELTKQEINGISTLFVPTLRPAEYDEEYLRKMNLRLDNELASAAE